MQNERLEYLEKRLNGVSKDLQDIRQTLNKTFEKEKKKSENEANNCKAKNAEN